MKIEAITTGLGSAILDLTGTKAKIHERWKKSAKIVGEKARAFIIREYRTGGTTDTRTAVRSGKLRAAYDNRVDETGTGIDLSIGLIKPGTDGKVLMYGRMQEGYNAAGGRFQQMIIKAKNAPYLSFPIRQGGGLAKKNITGWARVKQVTFKPRPSLDAVAATYPPILEERLVKDVHNQVMGA